MPKQLALRELTPEEQREVARLASSRTEPARRVQRAKIIQAMRDDPTLPATQAGRRAGYQSDLPGRWWVKRFNAQGLAGLEDESRSGHPRTHRPETRSQLISLALQKPDTLGYPFALWTLERLQTAFEAREKTHLSDSTIWEWLAEEGLEWKRQESWFHDVAQHDAAFVEKRGP